MKNIYTVSQINKYIKGMFQADGLLSSVFIKGEVSNLKYHTSGHVYFSLKDNNASVSCVMFAGKRAKGLPFRMQNGDKVVVGGQIDVYETAGRYQVYADEIKKEGMGDLYERFLMLKKKLADTGMFDVSYKIPIKKYNMRIGVVTAPTGAVIQDIRNVSFRRNPYVQIYLYPAVVQGSGAKESIVRGIEFFNDYGVDVIIVARGGGSIEDLWAFNEEEVARAIFASKTPVISAVGHETDVTISDMVADLRAPTPSAAAELAVFDYNEFQERLEGYFEFFNRNLENNTKRIRIRISHFGEKLELLSPENMIRIKQDKLYQLQRTLNQSIENKTSDASFRIKSLHSAISGHMMQKAQITEHKMNLLIERIKGLAPFDRLKQGFSFTENEIHENVRSIKQVKKGDRINVRVHDGTILSVVENVRSCND